MKWIFRPFFIAENEIACSTDSYFSNLSYIEERDLLVSLPWSWPFRDKNVRLSARGQNMQIFWILFIATTVIVFLAVVH